MALADLRPRDYCNSRYNSTCPRCDARTCTGTIHILTKLYDRALQDEKSIKKLEDTISNLEKQMLILNEKLETLACAPNSNIYNQAKEEFEMLQKTK